MSDLPAGWLQAKLGDVCDLGGRQVDPQQQPTTLFNYVEMENVEQGTGRLLPIGPTLGREIGSTKCQFSSGDVLYGKLRPYLRKAVVAPFNGVSVTDLLPLSPRPGVEARFIRDYLLSPYHMGYITPLMAGIRMPRLRSGDIAGMPIPLAPSREQRRIVAKIETLTARSRDAREALEQVPPLLERFRQSVLAAAFRGDLTAEWRRQHPDAEPASVLLERIRAERRRHWEDAELAAMRAKDKKPNDDKWKQKYVDPQPANPDGLPALPPGWRWARWEQIGFCQNGHTYPSKFYSDVGTRLLRPGNLHVSGRVVWTAENTRWMPSEWEDDSPRHVVHGNELVINLTAQSLKDEFLGRICLTDPGERCLLNQRIGRLTPVMLSKRYLLWLFKAPVFRRYVDGLSTGSLIQHMFTSQINEFVLPVAPEAEQGEIVRVVEQRLDRVQTVLRNLQGGAERLAMLDHSILAKAFRGELVPQDPSDEPASVLLERIRADRESAEPEGSSEPRARKPPKRARKSATAEPGR